MNRFCLLAIGSMLLIAPGMLAQQTAPTGEPAKGAAQGVVTEGKCEVSDYGCGI